MTSSVSPEEKKDGEEEEKEVMYGILMLLIEFCAEDCMYEMC